jgi:prepilin signal peptidase PulO-like enzyme (type II secretory pathway)
MFTALGIYFFLLGLIIGSFLNVIILRFNTGKTIKGRSACMSCKTKLTWKELIPVCSFLFQKGRCKTCKTKLKWQYPLVELATGLLFVLNFYVWVQHAVSYTHFVLGFAITTCILTFFVIIFVYDMRHKIIPDLFSLTAWGLSIVFVLTMLVIPAKAGIPGSNHWISAFAPMTIFGSGVTNTGLEIMTLLNLSAGLIFYLTVYLIWKLSKGRMIGLGDAKLLLSIGTVLGIVYGLSSIFISVWIATIYAIYILLKHNLSKKGKHITMKTEIPFGPFLIIGFLIVYFTNIDVTGIGIILENFL